jgi:hypothetical protein
MFLLLGWLHSINPQARVAGYDAGPNKETRKFEIEG